MRKGKGAVPMNGWLLRYLTKPGAKYYREEALAEYHKYEAVVKAAREWRANPSSYRAKMALFDALAALDPTPDDYCSPGIGKPRHCGDPTCYKRHGNPTEAPEWNTPEPHVRRGVPVDMSDYPDADSTEAPEEENA